MDWLMAHVITSPRDAKNSYSTVIVWLRGVYMSILHFDNVTKIGIFHVLIRFEFTSSMTLARLK